MKFDILNRFTGAVQFTAEIECSAHSLPSIKAGLAVKAAVKEKANLEGANFYGANLEGANLVRANFVRANLEGANFYGANLEGANFYGANLEGANLVRANFVRANLEGANFYGANFYGANLVRANLVRANLVRANLVRANLVRANFYGANLYGANLYGANLEGANGNNEHIKSLQAGAYTVAYTDTIMQIGCQRHVIADWWAFDDHAIAGMDGEKALEFWRSWKKILQHIIEASPAKPTGYRPESKQATT